MMAQVTEGAEQSILSCNDATQKEETLCFLLLQLSLLSPPSCRDLEEEQPSVASAL